MRHKIHAFREFRGSVASGLKPMAFCGRPIAGPSPAVWDIYSLEGAARLSCRLCCKKSALRVAQELAKYLDTTERQVKDIRRQQGLNLDRLLPIQSILSEKTSQPSRGKTKIYDGEF